MPTIQPDQFRIFVNKGRFSSVAQAAHAETDIDWWDDTCEDAFRVTDCFAAWELATHLFLAHNMKPDEQVFEAPGETLQSSVTLWIGEPSPDSSIGRAWELYRKEITTQWEELSDEGYVIRSFKLEASYHLVMAGKGKHSHLYAVYALLEKLGFRWFGLGLQGTHIPNPENMQFEELHMIESPKFKTRGTYSEHINDDNDELIHWLGRNRINFASLDKISRPHALKKRGIQLCAGGHNILYRFLNPHVDYPYRHRLFEGNPNFTVPDPYPVSPDYQGDLNEDGVLSYCEAHPEWFGLVNGKRSFDVGEGDREGYGDNFCTTNEFATSELCHNLVEDLIYGEWHQADYINFWMLDNGTWCSCERCNETGNYSYKLILLVHRLNEEITIARSQGRLKRNVNIIFPIYHETLPAPDRELPAHFDYEHCFPTYFPIERCYVHTIDDIACTETNQELMATFRGWTTAQGRNYKGELYMGEYYNVGSFAGCPVPFISIMSHDIPYYYHAGIRHFHYMHMTGERWGTLTLTNYQLYRMLWDPELDMDALLRDYFSLFYGSASAIMRSFYERLEEAMRNAKYLKHYQYHLGTRHSLTGYLREGAEELFPLMHMKYDSRMPGLVS